MERMTSDTAWATDARKAVVIVDPVHTGTSLAQAAARMGYEVIPLYTLPRYMVPEADFTQFDIMSYCFEPDPSRALRVVDAECRRRSRGAVLEVVAVMPGAEPGVELACLLAERLGLPGNRPALPHAFRDKAAMRAALRDAGLPQPKFADCRTRDELSGFASQTSFPIVVKAPASAGADGVFKCDGPGMALAAFDQVMGHASVFGEFASHVVAEEYVDGPEYVVDLLGHGDGSHSVMGCWRYENRDDMLKSSILLLDPGSPGIQSVIKAAKAAAKALGMLLGPVHCEVKDDPTPGPTRSPTRGAVLIEAGARLCGLNMPSFYAYACGRSAQEIAVSAFLKDTPRPLQPVTYVHRRHAAILLHSFDLPGQAAVVREFRGADVLASLPSFQSLEAACEPGAVLTRPRSLVEQHAFTFLANDDRAVLERDMRAAASALDVMAAPLPDVLREFVAAGLDPVIIACGDTAVAPYRSNISEFRRPVMAALRPRNLREVQQALAIANRLNAIGVHTVHLHPLSTGKNWSLGSKLPPGKAGDNIILDLRRLDRIEEVDEAEGYMLVRPGVTQGQASEYLALHHPDVLINITGGYGGLSLMGNCLDRGDGVMGSRVGDTLGLEVFLADGEFARIGGFRPSGEAAEGMPGFYHPPGLGPCLTHAFTQSNFGVAVGLAYRLRPRPERSTLVWALFERKDLKNVLDVLLSLVRKGLLDRDYTRVGTEMAPPSAIGIEEEKRGLRGVVPRGHFVFNSFLAGDPDVVEVQVRKVQSAFAAAGIPSLAFDYQDMTPEFLARLDGQPDFIVGLATTCTGGVLWKRLGGAYQGQREPHHYFYDLDETPRGMVSFLPAWPAGDLRHCEKLVEMVEAAAAKYGVFPIIGIELFGIALVMIMFDRRDPTAVANAQACKDALYRDAMAAGYMPHRADIEVQAEAAARMGTSLELANQIKACLDPNGVISPGRYGLGRSRVSDLAPASEETRKRVAGL